MTGPFVTDGTNFCIRVPALKRPTLGQLKKRFPDAEIKSITEDKSSEDAALFTVNIGDRDEIIVTGPKDFEFGYQHFRWLEKQDKTNPLLLNLLIKAAPFKCSTQKTSFFGGSNPYVRTGVKKWPASIIFSPKDGFKVHWLSHV